MDSAIIRRIDMRGTELLNIEKMVRESVDEERIKVGKKAIRDLLALSAHPKMKEWSENLLMRLEGQEVALDRIFSF